ncbi:RagB/SusD family nutrient uptake outer membrane protein [Sunxiuqinia sp. A32]|uniref:RagB/SusD family nutrient uptake outer membrane protein n=1 Tax=Sunxiuqinia sp. A32 TaxID=3461496 RepID=UPI0040462D3D
MKKYIIILFTGLIIFSCSESYLDIPQKGVMDLETTYANADDEQAEQLIANVYAYFKLMIGDWGADYFIGMSTKGGDFWSGGSDSGDGPQYQAMMMMTDDSSNKMYKEMYSKFYQIIYKSNAIVEKLPADTPLKQRVIAEARACRAWAMMYLVQLWGTPPLVSHTLNGSAEYPYEPMNTSKEESWAWVMNEYEEAAKGLPSKSGLGGQQAIGGRFTAEACYGFMGKGYAWQGDWDNAKKYLAMVINSGKYALWNGTTTLGTYGPNVADSKAIALAEGKNWIDGSDEYEYSTLFRAAADFCDENLLETDVDGDATTVTNTEPWWFYAYTGWRNDEVYLPGNSVNGASWGFLNPTGNFGQAFCKHDGNGIRRRGSMATYDEVYYDFPYSDSAVRGIMSGKRLYGNQGFFRLKFYNWADDIDQDRWAAGNKTEGNHTNFKWLRYADILLLYAEAVQQSSEGTANITGLQALNMVRDRAGLDPAPSLSADDSNYGIKAERRFELCAEGCDRYIDLVRWGDYKSTWTDPTETGVGPDWGKRHPWLGGFIDPDKGRGTDPADVSNYNVTYDVIPSQGSWNDKFLVFPFPYDEMTNNRNLVQNTGW